MGAVVGTKIAPCLSQGTPGPSQPSTYHGRNVDCPRPLYGQPSTNNFRDRGGPKRANIGGGHPVQHEPYNTHNRFAPLFREDGHYGGNDRFIVQHPQQGPPRGQKNNNWSHHGNFSPGAPMHIRGTVVGADIGKITIIYLWNLPTIDQIIFFFPWG